MEKKEAKTAGSGVNTYLSISLVFASHCTLRQRPFICKQVIIVKSASETPQLQQVDSRGNISRIALQSCVESSLKIHLFELAISALCVMLMLLG